MFELIDSNPLVTVYIPTYNRVELLKRAVESVRQQTYKNLEIIIVDDCSIDGTHDYLKEITEQDARIRFFLKEKNSGACVSRNIAIENATGEFITGLDDDDYFLENRISTFVERKSFLEAYCALCSNYLIHKPKKTKPSRMLLSFFSPKEIGFEDMLISNFVGNQIFTKTSRIKEIKFNINLSAWQDLYSWLVLLRSSNKKIYNFQEASYIVDISHPHERISKNKKDVIRRNYDVFCNDFNLNRKQQEILFFQTINYGYKINLLKHFKYLICNPKPIFFMVFLLRFKIYLINLLRFI